MCFQGFQGKVSAIPQSCCKLQYAWLQEKYRSTIATYLHRHWDADKITADHIQIKGSPQ